MAILQKTGITGSLSISSSGIRSTTSASLFNVNGYNGRLLSVVDTLSGSLFSVNSIAGLPIFEVFSNNKVVAGKYAANDFVISGSRVGIGTSSPAYTLDVSPNTSTVRLGRLLTGAWPAGNTYAFFGNTSLDHSGGGNYALLQYTDGTTFINAATGTAIYFRIANATKMMLDSNGNVGIGTTVMSAPLFLNTSTTTSTTVGNKENRIFFRNYSTTANNGAEIVIGAEDTTTGRYAAIGTDIKSNASGNAIGDVYIATKTATSDTSLTRRLVVQADGNIGIGTTSTTGMFEIYKSTPGGLGGTLILNNDGTVVANETAIIFGDGSSTTRRAAISSTTEGSPYYGDIKFKTGLSAYSSLNTRMIILGNGNVGIGTTGPSALLNIRASAPTSTGTVTTGTNLLIDSNTSNYITFRNTGDNATYAGLTFLDNNTGGYVVFRNYASNDVIAGSDCMIYGTYQDHIFQNGTSETINAKPETMRIKQNGSVGIGANSPNAKLHISSSTTTALRIETKVGSGTDTQIEYVGPDTHSYAIGLDNSDSNKFKISYAASRTPPNLGTNDRFVIQTDGKIGIGTSVAETDLSIVDMNLGRVGIGTVTYYGVWLTGGTSATDYSFLSSPSDTNLYLNAPSTKGIYNQINNVNRFIITTDFVRINNSAAGADGEEFQRWSYISTDNYYLKLIQTVTAGVVRYNFCMVNNATAYNNVLVLDRGNVGIGTVGAGSPAALAAKLDVLGTVKISDDTGIGAVNDGTSRLYVQGESLTEPFLSVQTCLGNNSTLTATYNTLKGYLAVKIGNNVGSGTALITAGTYYLRLWGT